MGLDITYYKNLKEIACVFDADGEPIDTKTGDPLEEYFQPHVNKDFPTRADGLKDKAVYEGEHVGGFRAGSYGGYNQWREQLAELAGYAPAESGDRGIRFDAGAWAAGSGPFFELINFSDCEGVIGATISAKLAKDFAEFQSKADAHEDEWFKKLYAEWRTAFETAQQFGAVDFH